MKRVLKLQHDKDAKLDYAWDWTDWLGIGETITSQTVTGPAGFTVTNVNVTSGVVTAWCQTAVSGLLTCHITTSLGRQEDRSFFLLVQSR